MLILLKDIYKFLSIKNRFNLIKLLLYSIISAFLELFSIALIIPIIGFVLLNSQSSNNFFGLNEHITILNSQNFIFLLFISIYLAKLIFNIFYNYERERFVYKLQKELSNELLVLYLNQPMKFFLERNTSEFIRNVQTATWEFIAGTLKSYIILITEIIIVMTLTIFLFYLYPLITLILFIFLFFAGFSFLHTYKKKMNSYRTNRLDFENQTVKSLLESLGAIREIKIYQKKNFFISSFFKNLDKVLNIRQNIEFIGTIPRIFYEFILILSVFLIFIFSYFLEFHIEGLISMITVYLASTIRLLPSASKITHSMQNIKIYRSSFDLIKKEFILDKIKPKSIIEKKNKF